jgi:hypothetical protein
MSLAWTATCWAAAHQHQVPRSQVVQAGELESSLIALRAASGVTGITSHVSGTQRCCFGWGRPARLKEHASVHKYQHHKY